MLSLSDALANLSHLPLLGNLMSSDFFTSVVKDNIWSFIWFVAAYVFVFIVIPARILHLNLCDGNFIDSALTSLVVSQTCVSFVVFVLSFMRIYNRLTLVLALIVGVMFTQKFRFQIRYRERLNHFIYDFSDLITGQRKLSMSVIPFYRRMIDNVANGVKHFIKFYFDKNVAYHLICTVCIFFLVLRRFFFAMTSQAFPTSDVSVHTSWVNFLDAGWIFCDGIYPFSMHNIVSAFAKLTFIDVVTVMRFIGPLNAILAGLMLLAFITRIFKSPAAATVVALIYCISSYGNGALVDRMIFSVPQEFGMFYIFPAAYFMVKFLEEKENMDGVAFAMAASMTVSTHFYNAIFAVPLCLLLLIPYIPSVLKDRKLFAKMIMSAFLAAFLALAPFGVGLAMGYHWQGSLDWAVSMMSGVDEGDKDSSKASKSQEEKKSDAGDEEQEQGPSFIETSVNSFKSMRKDFTHYWGWVVLGCAAASIVLGAAALFTKHKMAGKVAIGLGAYVFAFNYLLLNPEMFGLPSLVGHDRTIYYLVYTCAIILGVPFGVFWLFFEEKLRGIRWTASVALVTAVACLIAFTGATYVTSAYFRLSYSSVTEVYYKIKDTHRKDTWTIVSSVDELALTRNKGWHYELWEFIFSMEQYEPTRVIQIPTEYVYFVIEKRPLKYADTAFLGQQLELYGRVGKEYASELLSEQTLRTSRKSDYYGNYEIRRAIMSKAYYWAQQYMTYFPDQMREYYEDQNIVVYEIHQNMFALNNFAIDYKYNTMTFEQWLELHPEALGGKQEETVSDSDLAVTDETVTDGTVTNGTVTNETATA